MKINILYTNAGEPLGFKIFAPNTDKGKLFVNIIPFKLAGSGKKVKNPSSVTLSA